MRWKWQNHEIWVTPFDGCCSTVKRWAEQHHLTNAPPAAANIWSAQHDLTWADELRWCHENERPAVKHINLWPPRELNAATRDDLQPRRWCWTWLGGRVLGHVFCSSPRQADEESVWRAAAVSAQTHRTAYGLGEGRYLHTRYVRHPWPYSQAAILDRLLEGAADNNEWHHPTYCRWGGICESASISGLQAARTHVMSSSLHTLKSQMSEFFIVNKIYILSMHNALTRLKAPSSAKFYQ